MLTPVQAAAVAARYPQTVEAEGARLYDLDTGAAYDAPTVRHALGWIMAGEYDSHVNPPKMRLAHWWQTRGGVARWSTPATA